MENLKIMEALTEKGIVKHAVRDNLKEQVTNNFFENWDLQKDGSLTMDLVQNTGGEIIRARVQLTISAKQDFKSRSGSRTTETETVEIPSLF